MAATVYKIRALADFAKVPADRRPLCLAECAAFLTNCANSREFCESGLSLESFEWKDDGVEGLEGIRLCLEGPQGEVQEEFIPNPDFPVKKEARLG